VLIEKYQTLETHETLALTSVEVGKSPQSMCCVYRCVKTNATIKRGVATTVLAEQTNLNNQRKMMLQLFSSS
jgi:hypothetical protein